MAKGDHDRGERRIDEQMKQAQSYLTPIQQQLGNQYAGYNNAFWGGGGAPQVGNVYGWGSTVPSYSPYGPIFSGNGTDTPVNQQGSNTNLGYQQGMPENRTPGGMTQVGSSQTADAKSKILQYLQSQGSASSETLERSLPALQQMYPGLRRDSSSGPLDEIVLPDGTIVDLISNAETGGQKSWTYQTSGGGSGSPGGSPQSGGGFGGGVFNRNLNDYNDIYNRYSQFADTGGYSQQDLGNIRSRALSPIRSAYSSAQQGLERQRSLQGGYSPGMSTAISRMAREQGQLGSDIAGNTEASIAEMVNQGKRFGVSGMQSSYGTTPGLSNMVGQQMLQSQGQQLTAAGLQNQLSLGMTGAQQNLASIPGNVDSTLGTIGRIGNVAGMVGGGIYPWLGQGGSGIPQVPGYNPTQANW